MKKHFTSSLGLAALAVLCLAHAANAAPVGSLSCVAPNGDIKFNVSYFTFGLTQSLNVGSFGGGAGRVTLQPLEVHAALSTFATLAGPAAEGRHYENCTLTTALADGSTATFLFKPVIIKELTAVGERTGTSETPAQYTSAEFEYETVQATESGGTDDGGVTAPTTTNRITILTTGPQTN